MNFSLTYRCVCFLVLWVFVGTSETGICRVDQIQLQSNLNLSKYTGRWLELQWLADSPHPPADQWTDFAHVYRQDGNGDLVGIRYYREPNNDAVCKITNFTITKTSTPAKLNYSQPTRSYGFWVVATDYENYSLVYSCSSTNLTTGGCPKPRVWLWSRHTDLAPALHQQVLDLAQSRLCINASFMITTPHSPGKECPQESNGGQAGGGGWTMALTTLIVVCQGLLQSFVSSQL